MIKHLTDKELADELRDINILIDTREQVNNHITDYLDSNNVEYIERKLDVGDYSCQLHGMTFEKDFVIERKHNLDEIAGNFTQGRERFEREFMRAKANGTKVFLIIENATWDDVYLHNYSSKLNPSSLLASLLSWQTRFNVTIIMCKKSNTPKLIHGILYYAVREELINGR